MSPPDKRRPSAGTEGQVSRHGGRDALTVHRPADQIRRRHDGALRLEPIRLGLGLARHDPWLDEVERAPSSFGLRRAQLEAEVARCRAAGWSGWELLERFANPATVAA